MRTASKVLRYELRNVARGRAVVGYALVLALATWSLVTFAGGAQRALPSLASLTLVVVPLVSLLVTVTAMYEGADFTELLLAHPVTRSSLMAGRVGGLALALGAAYALGVGVPLGLSGVAAELAGPSALLLLSGVLLSVAFVAIGALVAVVAREPARGLGAALLVWVGLTLLYDGVVLVLAQAFAAYPLERPLLAAMLLNPIDLARVATMVALDAAALAGYTGAVFTDFFGGWSGPAVVAGGLLLWIVVPFTAAVRRFRTRDL